MNQALGTIAAALVVAGTMVAGPAQGQAVTYENTVKKILDDNCLKCHGKGAPTMEEFKKDEDGFKKKMKGPRMATYDELMVMVNGSDTGALMRRLDDGKNTKDGKPGNMHKFLGNTDPDRAKNLASVQQWVGGWTLKRKKDIGEAELKAIKAVEK